MKKHLFFLFAALTLLTAPGAMRAQTTVAIGNESSTNSAYIMPVNMYYNYSLTQQIYRADEINMPDGGTITSISFEYLYSGAFSLSGIKVFMKNTTKENFTNNNDWVEVSASDKVFEGTFSASGAGWVTLTRPVSRVDMQQRQLRPGSGQPLLLFRRQGSSNYS